MSDIDWKSPFSPEDFASVLCEYEFGTPHQDHTAQCSSVDAAEAANRRFRELIEQCPVVYGQKVQDWITCDPCWLMSDGSSETTDTHQARLICIEELKK